MRIIWNHPYLKYFFSLNELIQNNVYNFKLFTEPYIFSFSLSFIRAFSVSQIYLKKINRFLTNKIFKTNPSLNEFISDYYPEKITNNVDFVVSGKVVYSTTKKKLLQNTDDKSNDFIKDSKLLSNSFIVYTEINNENPERPITYKKIISEYPCESKHFECKPADFKFLLTEILIDDKIIMINLSSDEHNYFVVDNNLDNHFIKYYLNKYHEKQLLENDILLNEVKNFDVRILDQDVKQEIFSNNKSIIINKDNYEVNQ